MFGMRNIVVVRTIVTVMILAAVGAGIGLAGPISVLAQTPAGQEESADDSVPAVDAATEVEIQRRFNELRREALEDRAGTIEWWLTGIALFLAALVSIAAAFGYIVIRRLQAFEREMRGMVEHARAYAAEAAKFAEEARGYEGDVDEPLRSMATADLVFARAQIGEDLSRDPGRAGASAIADARQLEEEGRLGEAVERWRHIANVAEGTNDELAALAFRSIGDLSERLSRSARL